MDKMKCGICGKIFRVKESSTIRKAWLQASGWGEIPIHAIVHPVCDDREQVRLDRGQIKLTDIYTKKTS